MNRNTNTMTKGLFFTLLSLLLLIKNPVFSQNDQERTLIGNIGDRERATNICADLAGNKYIGGKSDSKGLIVKQNALHVTQWIKALRFTSNPVDEVSIEFLDIVGDTIFGCGKIHQSVMLGIGSFYFKMNAQTGAMYWSKYETSGVNYLSCMRYANGKFFLIGGSYNDVTNQNTLNRYGKIMAVSSQTGQIIWQSLKLNGAFLPLTTNFYTTFLSSTEMVNGKMYITGQVSSYFSTGGFPFIMGVDENGAIFLEKKIHIPYPGPGMLDYSGVRIELDQDKKLILAVNCIGINSTVSPNLNSLLIKCDTLGNLIFAKRYSSTNNYTLIRSINETSTSYVMSGVYASMVSPSSSSFVVKVSKNGSIEKGISITKPNTLYSPVYCYPYVMGNSTFINGQHYFAVTEVPNASADSDINQFILDEGLNTLEDCSELAEVGFVASDIPVSILQLWVTNFVSQLSFSDGGILENHVINDLCAGSSLNLVQNPMCNQVVISANVSGFTSPTFYWSDGTVSTTNTLTVNTTDTVIVRVLDTKCCELIDTIIPVIVPYSFTMSLPADTTICLQTGSSFTINPTFSGTNGAVQYSWNNNSTGSSLAITNSGTYWVDVTDHCSTKRDSIVVVLNFLPLIGNTANVTVCEDDFPATLSPTVSSGASVLWDDGTTTINRLINGPGNYTLAATNSCGTTNATIVVSQADLPDVHLESSIDTCIQNGGSIVLTPILNQVNTVLWSNGSTGNQLTVSNSGTYVVYGSNACGIDSASIVVSLNSLSIIGNTANVVVCEDDFPATLNPTVSPGASVLWDDGTITTHRSVNGPGSYTFAATNSCGTTNATIVVSQNNLPDVQLISNVDTCLQTGGMIVLVPVFTDVSNVLWSNGSTGNQLSVSASGTYTIFASNECGTSSATCSVMINHFPELDLPAVLDTCFEIGVGFAYTAQGSGGSYQWNSGSQTAMEWISQEGIYACTLTNQCGSITDSMNVRRVPDVDLYFPEDSISDCLRQLSVSLLHIETNYNLEILAPYYGVVGTYLTETGWYTIHAFNKCWHKWDSIHVNLQNEIFFYLPNSFTPNGDSHNERFEFEGENVEVRNIRIFNRWGEEIFSQSGDFTGWDGTYKGENCPDGMYAVSVIYEDCFGVPTEFNGHVNLLR